MEHVRRVGEGFTQGWSIAVTYAGLVKQSSGRSTAGLAGLVKKLRRAGAICKAVGLVRTSHMQRDGPLISRLTEQLLLQQH